MAATVQLDPATFAFIAHLRCDLCHRYRWDSRVTCSPGLVPGETEVRALQVLRRTAETEGWIWPEESMEPVVCPACRGEREGFDTQWFLDVLHRGHLDLAFTRLYPFLQNCHHALMARRTSAGAQDATTFGRELERRLADRGSGLIEQLGPLLDAIEPMLVAQTPFTSVPLRGFQHDGVRPGDTLHISGTQGGHLDGDYTLTSVNPPEIEPTPPPKPPPRTRYERMLDDDL